MSTGRTVRPSMPGDQPKIAALLDGIFGPVPYAQRTRLWSWRHRDNPASGANGGGPPEFLVVEDGGGLTGVHGQFPLRVKVGERIVVAAISCDFAVDPEARGAGMPLKLEAMSPEVAELMVSTSANGDAERIFEALGGSRVPWGRTKFLKPLRASGLVRQKLRSGLEGAAAATAGAIARAGGVGADAALRWTRAARRRLTSGGHPIETVERFDARFDRLWDRLRERLPVAVVRDAEYLEWRYGRYPFPGIESFAATAGDEALGFAAVHHTTDEGGLRFTALLDLFALDGELTDALLTEAVRRADERGSHYLTAKAGAGGLREFLEDRGFVARKSEYCPYTYRSNDAELESLLADPDNWYVAQGDGDICFFMQD